MATNNRERRFNRRLDDWDRLGHGVRIRHAEGRKLSQKRKRKSREADWN